MRNRNSVRMLAAVATIAMLVTSKAAVATMSCPAAELAATPPTCAEFKIAGVVVATVRFLSVQSDTCPAAGPTLPTGSFPCTKYFYEYTGGYSAASNALDVAIPKKLLVNLNDAPDVGCSVLFPAGTGDTSTKPAFGASMNSQRVCQEANLPGPSVTVPFTIQTDPSFFDPATPLDWQFKRKISAYDDDNRIQTASASLIGPVTTQTPIAPTVTTVTAANGASITIRARDGEKPEVLFANVPFEVRKLRDFQICAPTTTPADPGFPTASTYNCEPWTFGGRFADDQKAGDNSTCYKPMNGYAVKYTC